MTMESLRISCYILSLFPFILAAVTVYYCSRTHATNDASYFMNHILTSSFKRQHKSGFNCPQLSAIVYTWWILTISHNIQHTTYMHRLSTHRRHARGLVSCVRPIPAWSPSNLCHSPQVLHHLSHFDTSMLSHGKNMKCLILSLWPVWTVGCRMLRVPYDRPVSQANDNYHGVLCLKVINYKSLQSTWQRFRWYFVILPANPTPTLPPSRRESRSGKTIQLSVLSTSLGDNT